MSAWYEGGGDHGSHWRCHTADRIDNGGFAGDGYANGAGHGDGYAGQAYRFDHNPGGSDGSGRDRPFGGAAGEAPGGFIFGWAPPPSTDAFAGLRLQTMAANLEWCLGARLHADRLRNGCGRILNVTRFQVAQSGSA